MTTIVAVPPVVRRRRALALLFLGAVALAAAAWGAWRQPVGYIRDDANNRWTDRVLHPVWSNQPRPGLKSGRSVTISDDGRIAIAVVGYLYRTEDGGARWLALPMPERVLARKVALSADGRRAIGFGARNEILRSEDGGVTWSVDDSGAPDLVHVVLSGDGMRGMLVGYDLNNRPSGGRLLRTTDGGRTWSAQPAPPWQMVLAADGLHAIAWQGQQVRRTTDGGATWTSLALPSYDGPQAMALSADGRVAVGGSFRGKVWRSEDSGQTWSVIATLAGRRFERMAMSHDGSRLAALSHGESIHDQALHVSADGGASWTTTELYGDDWHHGIALSADGLRGIMVAYGRRPIWRTGDGGKTWQQPEPAVRLMPYWPFAAAAAAAFLLALGIATLRRRTA